MTTKPIEKFPVFQQKLQDTINFAIESKISPILVMGTLEIAKIDIVNCLEKAAQRKAKK